MKKTALAGITALVVVLSVAATQGRAGEAPIAESPAQESAERNSGVDVSIIPDEKLTVERCVQVALRNSPNILEAFHSVNESRSRVGQAWSVYYPQITLSSTYTKEDTLVNDFFNTGRPSRQDGYNNRAELTQNIFNFGRIGGEVSARRKELEASGEELRKTTSEIVFNVKKAYYELLKAGKSREVLRESVALFEKMLEQARSFYEAGERSKFDVTNAEVELGSEKLKLITAEIALRVARVTLNSAMGMPEAPEYTIEDDTLPFQKYLIAFEEARDRALLNRPGIRAAAALREAAGESLSVARKEHLPTLSANANYNRSGEAYPPDQDTWQVDIRLSVPFFSGFMTTHRVGEAKEKLSALKAREKAARQDVLLDVQKVYLKLQETEERVGVAELTVKQAEENYELAHGRYEAGVGSSIEETKSLVDLSNARMNLVAALADHKTAEAELQKAMGE